MARSKSKPRKFPRRKLSSPKDDPRPAVTSHYTTNLKYCLFFHAILCGLLFLKLVPTIAASYKMFPFDLSNSELNVLRPLFWEKLWPLSLATTFFSWYGIRNQRVSYLVIYIIGVLFLGYLPLIYGLAYYAGDVGIYFMSKDYYELMTLLYWKEYPYGVLWYLFIIPALLCHSISIYYVYKTMTEWKARGSRRTEEQ